MAAFARHGCGFRQSDYVLRQLCCVKSWATSFFESDAHSTQLGLYESGFAVHSTTTKRAQGADRGRPKVACKGYCRTQVDARSGRNRCTMEERCVAGEAL